MNSKQNSNSLSTDESRGLPERASPQTIADRQGEQKSIAEPGRETEMNPAPLSFARNYIGTGKLRGKVAVVTGGDSGIGRSTAISLAKEGADVVIIYFNEHDDARLTEEAITEVGCRCFALDGDLCESAFVTEVVRQTVDRFGRIDVLINNAAEQHVKEDIADISFAQLEKTFRTNFFAMFQLCREALPHMPAGGSIVNTTSITAYRGSKHLLDYAASKGAIVSFTRSLAQQVAERKIRVNAVAPGPVWTALIASTFKEDELARFGKDTLLGRAGQPDEISPAFVFLATSQAAYMTGQVLHPNGGEIINT